MAAPIASICRRAKRAPAVRPTTPSICSTHGLNQACQDFSETELGNFTPCVAAINAWNRIAISFRAVHPTHWKGAARRHNRKSAAIARPGSIAAFQWEAREIGGLSVDILRDRGKT